MAVPQAYDTNNVFARILRGELPCQKIYEDDHSLAFMDIMPRADGHALVIPKSASRNLFDMEPAALDALFRTVQKIARAVRTGMAAEGVLIQQANESAGGQVVFHTHVHVIPRWDGVRLRPHTGEMAPRETLLAHAEKIRAAL